jgi:branched-chain amino acid transport system substrate-binding protein
MVAAAGMAGAVLAGGCGGAEGVEEGATVAVYVSGPLSGPEGGVGRAQCGTAGRELQRHGADAGEVQVRVHCLDSAADAGNWTLAGVGANARRASEDSTTVGYIGETSPRATRFSQPILDAAGIAQVSGMSGREAMARIFSAIEAAGDAGNLREVVDEEISAGA